MPGIALGLFAGKQIGIFGSIWLSDRLGVARIPQEVNWLQIYGMAMLCGIGFTISLFIGSLAWPHRMTRASAFRNTGPW